MKKLLNNVSIQRCIAASCLIALLLIGLFLPSVAFTAPTSYRYDALNRLIQSINPAGIMTTYEYDAAGNRTLMRVTTGTLEKPIAAFTATPTEGMAPVQVLFKDASSGIIESWSWDFGDGNTSQEQSPAHTYTEPGSYTVTLTIANRDTQDTATKTTLVNVSSPTGPRPLVSLAHGFATDGGGTIDFSGSRTVTFRITLNNAGESDAVVDVVVDLASRAFIMVTPPANCLYDEASRTLQNISVPAGSAMTLDYTARYEGAETTNGAVVVNTARIRRIKEWYDEASGLNRGGYANLTAAATASIQSDSMILGRITDMSTGRAIPNATVTATGNPNTATDQDGNYRMSLSPGVYSLTISRNGYQTLTLSNVIILISKATLLNIELTTPGALAISTTNLPEGFVGTQQNPRVTISGGTYPYVFSLVSGTLPNGIILNSTTGNLYGTPTTPGDYTFTIGIQDKNNGYVERQYTLQVKAPLTITTSATLPRGTVNQLYDTLLSIMGGTAPYTTSVSAGLLPTGMTISAEGRISGTPVSSTSTVFTISVTDGAGATTTREFALSMDEPLRINTERIRTGLLGQAYNETLSGDGGFGAYTWSVVSGQMPQGITMQGQMGQLNGAPTQAGSGTVSISLQDSTGRTCTKAFAWEVGSPLQVVTATLPEGHKGYDYSGRIQTTGGVGQVLFTCLGNLPPGLNLGKETGVISGRPTVAGFSNIVIAISDAAFPAQLSTTRTISVRISSDPPILPGDLNEDGSIGLEDAIIALRIISNIHVDNLALRNTINRKVGLADVIYILQWLSLSRSN